jgi:hypothetical protein
MTLNDLLRRFAVPAEGPARVVRGTVLAVAMEWLVRIPAGPSRDEAMNCLEEAADRACEALTSTVG